MPLKTKELTAVLTQEHLSSSAETARGLKDVLPGEASSYKQILKSSALIGGSSAISILLGVVRTKALALLVGPAGIGLIGLYNSITDLIGTLAGLGIGSSGVRQIAEAVGTGDESKFARTVTTLRRAAVFLGILGTLVLCVFSRPICRLTFGHAESAGTVAILSVVVFFTVVAGAQGALLQGMRRIRSLALVRVLGALFATLIGIPIIYALREHGIILFLLVVAVINAATSWWQARKIRVIPVTMGRAQVFSESGGLLALGSFFLASDLMYSGGGYLARLLVTRNLGVEAMGLYQAVASISTLYVGFILHAMGVDFLPRLTAACKNNNEAKRMLNEQTEISLLLAAPGILATLAFAPLVIQLFYSAAFAPAAEVLRWQVLGILLRVASWPLGFLLIARGDGKTFFWTELVGNTVQVGFLWVGIILWGLLGTGIAFFASYIVSWCMMLIVTRRVGGFALSAANIGHALVILLAVGVTSISQGYLPKVAAAVVGVILALLLSYYSLRRILSVLRPGTFQTWLDKFRKAFGFA